MCFVFALTVSWEQRLASDNFTLNSMVTAVTSTVQEK